MRNFGQFSLSLLKFILVFLSFTLEVKVRADVKVVSLSGRVEVEKSDVVKMAEPQGVFQEPFQLETFESSGLKVYINSIFAGVDEKSHVEIEKTPELNMYRGLVLIRVPETLSLLKDKNWFSIHTPNCDLKSSGAQFIVTVNPGRTTVSVVSGSVVLTDRASQKNIELKSGFEIWVGGLTAFGEHSMGRMSALSFVDAMHNLRQLSLLTPVEIQAESDKLRPAWRQAVETIAQNNQAEIEGDFKKLAQIQNERKLAAARNAESERKLRMYFREKTLPDPNRLPSSE